MGLVREHSHPARTSGLRQVSEPVKKIDRRAIPQNSSMTCFETMYEAPGHRARRPFQVRHAQACSSPWTLAKEGGRPEGPPQVFINSGKSYGVVRGEGDL